MNLADIASLREQMTCICLSATADTPIVLAKDSNAEPGFFPVASGFSPNSKPPLRTMMMGNNFGDEKYYDDFLNGRLRDIEGKTWKNLERLLWRVDRPQLTAQNCFFTNAYMDLMPSGKGMTGTTPGAKNQRFIDASRRFLGVQLVKLQPWAIVCLGKQARDLLARCSPDLLLRWRNRTLISLDQSGLQIVENLTIDGMQSDVIIALLLHPSRRNGKNLSRRRYVDQAGHQYENDAAEVEILRRVATFIARKTRS